MSDRKVYDVTYDRKKEDWKVELRGAERASARVSTKDQAIERGRELAKSHPLGQLMVHKKDGDFQKEYTYGKDPRNRKG